VDKFLARFLDNASGFLARRPGLLPLIGVGSGPVQFLIADCSRAWNAWLVDSNLFLHLGLIISILGLLLIKALG
jgi:hypothetical protein